MTASLPRLAVITDVPVERTQGGQLLLYRLLTAYPSERLLVLQSGHLGSFKREFQLPKVEYRRLDYRYPVPRFVWKKFNPLWPLVTSAGMKLHQKAAIGRLSDFAPEALLTVAHDFLWFLASAVARRLGLPLYLILHDDWPSMMTGNRSGVLWGGLRAVCRHLLRRVYRQAADRFCVSPGMAELYEAWYGVPGKVLYPNRGEDSPAPKVRVDTYRTVGKPVIAFAGALYTLGAIDLLRSMARIMAELGGHLDIYSQCSAEYLLQLGLNPPIVRRAGFFSPAELAERLAATSHALFLPASFRANERVDVSTLFPSKLADYTAIGLPLIIWGPTYSSAAQWGLENPDAAVTCTGLDLAPVRSALVRIINQPDYRATLARAAVEKGQHYFDGVQSRATLFDSLRLAKAGGGDREPVAT